MKKDTLEVSTMDIRLVLIQKKSFYVCIYRFLGNPVFEIEFQYKPSLIQALEAGLNILKGKFIL